MKAILDHYAEYDQWANTRYVERLLREQPEVLDAPAPGSFPTLRATLLHVRDAENVWHARIAGTPFKWPADERTGIETLITFCSKFRELVILTSEVELNSERTYADLKGVEHKQLVWHMIMHCLNHSAQHRGQVITQMRALGLADIPANDMVVYQRSLK